MVELTEIMRQQDDRSFTDILNRVRIGNLTENDKEQLLKRRTEKSDENYPCDVLHIWAEKKPVAEYNQQMLMSLDSPLVTLVAQDKYPPKASEQDIQKTLCKCRNETEGLDYIINIKEHAKVMLTTNLDVEDRLMGTVMSIGYDYGTEKVHTVYVKFDDEKAGQNRIRKSGYLNARQNHFVPISRIASKIRMRGNSPSSPEIQRTQCPLTLAWACTIHKVQGLTLSKVVFSFELFRQKSFNYG